jgi:hypothetical protein
LNSEHACFGIGRCRVHTRVGEDFTEGGFKVSTGIFWSWMGTLSLVTLVEYRYKFVCYFVCPSNSVGRGTICLSSGCLGTGARAADIGG